MVKVGQGMSGAMVAGVAQRVERLQGRGHAPDPAAAALDGLAQIDAREQS
jgi:hypothetical protein